MNEAPDTSGGGARRGSDLVAWIIALALAAAFLAVRLRHPAVFEYEAAESSVSAAAFVEHGIPPRAYHRIRYTAIYGGPLPAYLKTIPYLFTLDPGGELVFLNVLNAGAAIAFFFLLRRLYGLPVATLTFFLLAFSEPSIERCTSVHVRCYSVPIVLAVMVLVARILLLGAHRLMPLLAVAVAFATQVYGFATMFLPAGLLAILLLYRPKSPADVWWRSIVLFAVLQIPWIVDDVWRGVEGPLSALRNGLFTFPSADVEDVAQARAGALGVIASITKLVIFDNRLVAFAGSIGLVAMAVGAGRSLARRRDERADAFFSLWLALFLVLPAYLGAGGRTYLAQFLGPLLVARGIIAFLAWVRRRREQRGRSARPTFEVAAAAAALVAALSHLIGPRPTRVISDPAYPQSLAEVRAIVRSVHERGLGRIGFDQRVHGAVLQSDVYADSYLFWTLCRDDVRVPCTAGADALPPATHFAVLDDGFPFEPAEGSTRRIGTLRLVEYASRLRSPFAMVQLPSAAAAEADRLATLDPWPPDLATTPTFAIRRASQVAALMVQHDLAASAFAGEARRWEPTVSMQLVLRGTLDVERPLDPGRALRLFLTASPDGGRCHATILLDGVRLPQSRLEDRPSERSHGLLRIHADATAFARQPGRHRVTIRLHDCSAERFDFYDLVVARDDALGAPAHGASSGLRRDRRVVG